MRHNYKGRKLGTDFAHTKAMKRSLVQALFLNDRIKTIESRAKEIRPDVDKIITWAKKATCIAVVWPSPRWATTRNWSARSSRRSSRACSPIVRVATPAS